MSKGYAGLIAAVVVVAAGGAMTLAINEAVSTAKETEYVVTENLDWNQGTLKNITVENGHIQVSQGEKKGEYISQVFKAAGNLDRIKVDSSFYDTGTSASITVETSKSSSFNTVADKQQFNLSNGTETFQLNLDEAYFRVRANLDSGSSFGIFRVDTTNEWSQGTLVNLSAANSVISIDGKNASGTYDSQTFNLNGEELKNTSQVVANIQDSDNSSVSFTIETSDDGFSTVKDSQTYTITDGLNKLDTSGFAAADDLRTKATLSRDQKSGRFSADTDSEWTSLTSNEVNINISGGSLTTDDGTVQGTWNSTALYLGNDATLAVVKDWIEYASDTSNGSGGINVTVYSDDNTGFTSPDSVKFSPASGYSVDSLSNLKDDKYAKVKMRLEE